MVLTLVTDRPSVERRMVAYFSCRGLECAIEGRTGVPGQAGGTGRGERGKRTIPIFFFRFLLPQ